MNRFLAAFAVPWLVVLTACQLLDREWLYDGIPGRLDILASLVGLPLLGAWLALELAVRYRPMAAMDPRVHGTRQLNATGFLAGGAAVASMIGVFAVAPWMPQTVLIPLAAFVSARIALRRLPPAVPGHCVHCGYDLRGAGPCPECGAAGSVVSEARRAA